MRNAHPNHWWTSTILHGVTCQNRYKTSPSSLLFSSSLPSSFPFLFSSFFYSTYLIIFFIFHLIPFFLIFLFLLFYVLFSLSSCSLVSRSSASSLFSISSFFILTFLSDFHQFEGTKGDLWYRLAFCLCTRLCLSVHPLVSISLCTPIILGLWGLWDHANVWE
jgi:hypothetical protein